MATNLVSGVAFNQLNLEKVRQVFDKYDKDKAGSVYLAELVPVFSELGQVLTEADLFQLLSDVYEENPDLNKNIDTDNFDGNIEFHIFLRMVERLYRVLEEDNREQDYIDTFVSFGGNKDKSGKINVNHVKKVCEKFGLTVDVGALLAKIDTDTNGMIDYGEFKRLLSSNILY